MMRIIELCGPPGSGKTTLYEKLANSCRETDTWLPDYKLFPPIKINFSNPKIFLRSAFERLLYKYDRADLGAAAVRFAEENRPFVDCCWGNVYHRQFKGFNGIDNRFRSAQVWFNVFQKLQIIKESNCGKKVLVDEGIVQRIDSALFRYSNSKEEAAEIKDVLKIAMLPSAVIYLQANIEEVMERLQKRHKKLPYFEGLTLPELKTIYEKYHARWSYTFDVLKSQNIPILTINASDDVSHNVKQILHFLEVSETASGTSSQLTAKISSANLLSASLLYASMISANPFNAINILS